MAANQQLLQNPLSNHEIVVIAAYLAGAHSSRVDTEDIAVKANELSPGRFNWRKYPDQINIDAVRKRLWDACKASKGGYVVGSERKGWRLTETGTNFARKSLGKKIVARTRLTLKERTWLRSERNRLLTSEAFLKYKRNDQSAISQRDAEGFFRIDDYIDPETREEKVARVLNAFGADRLLGDAVKALATIVRGGPIGK